MSALGMASLGTQCTDKALGMASLGVYCDAVAPPETTPTYGSVIEPKIDRTHARILREDDEMLAIIMAFMETL